MNLYKKILRQQYNFYYLNSDSDYYLAGTLRMSRAKIYMHLMLQV